MTPTAEQQEAIYEFYCLIYSSNFAQAKKRTLMTSVMCYEKWSWRVVGITENAVRAIARNNYNKPKKILARDHVNPRAETYSKIFSGDLMSLHDWWSWVWERDKTVLMTNDEHHSRAISRVFEIDTSLGLFQCAGLVGWNQTKEKEGAYVESLVRIYGIEL